MMPIGKIFNVVHHAVQVPLRLDLFALVQVQSREPLVVP